MTTSTNAPGNPLKKRVLLLAIGLLGVVGVACVGNFYLIQRQRTLADATNIEGALVVAIKDHFDYAEAAGETPKIKPVNHTKFRLFVADCVERSILPPALGLALVETNDRRTNPITEVDITAKHTLQFHRADGTVFNHAASMRQHPTQAIRAAAERIRGGP